MKTLPLQKENDVISDGLARYFKAHLLVGLQEKDSKTNLVFISLNGLDYDLITALVNGCDNPDVKEALYEAVRIHKESLA